MITKKMSQIAVLVVFLQLLSVAVFAEGGFSGAVSAPAASVSASTGGGLASAAGTTTLSVEPGTAANLLSGEMSLNNAPALPNAAVEVQNPALQNSAETVSGNPPNSKAELFFSNDGGPVDLAAGGQHKVSSISAGLRQFGYDFFRNGSFKADQQAMVGPDYVIGPGDSMRIDVWGNIEGNYAVTVDRSGEITLPKVGVINLWGQTFTQAKETIRRQIHKYFKNFEFNATMGGLRSIQIFLVGEVSAPGTYQVSSLSTLVTALSSGGGPAKSGSLRKIQLLRNGSLVSTIDLYSFFLSGDKSADVRLQSGDTIFVPIAGPLVGVAGNVRRPAIYELLGGETLEQTLDLAGGLVPTAYLQKVQVSRVEAHQSRVVLDLDLQQASVEGADLNLPIQDRDMIRVAPIALDTGYVTLEGYVARPGKYQLTPEMRLKDLILPYDNLLPEFYPDLAQVIRVNPPEFSPEVLTVNLGSALQGLLDHDLLLQEYDRVKIFSRQQMEELPQVSVSGAVLKAGTYRLYANMKVKDLLTAAGNLKHNAYLDEAELTRYVKVGKEMLTERHLIDLDRVLAGDLENNIPLQPYDHLTVRLVPDLSQQQQVQLLGEVLLPGSYTITKGEKLSSVLKRAGGFAPDAYLYGAYFTRESAKKLQRQRIDRLLLEQEQELARVAADIAAGALSPEEAASAETVVASRENALKKLRQTPITGRMVVHLSPLNEFVGSRFDIEMMPGDVLVIPDNSKTVTVLGQVYNPISLVEEPGRTVSYYLSSVGGPTVNANEDQMFIVRADGTVYSKQQSGFGVSWDGDTRRWLMGGFNATRLYAGDALLVPEKLEKTDWMRESKDISSIIYQMALGAAAVASF